MCAKLEKTHNCFFFIIYIVPKHLKIVITFFIVKNNNVINHKDNKKTGVFTKLQFDEIIYQIFIFRLVDFELQRHLVYKCFI